MKALRHLNKYLLKYKWRLLLGIIFILISNIFAVYMPEIIDSAIDKMSSIDNTNFDNESFTRIGIYLCLLYLFFAFMKGIFLFFTRQTIIVMSRLIEYDLKNEIFNKYQKLNSSFYKDNKTGDLMNRISEDVSKVRMYLGPAIMYTINVSILFILVITFMLNKNIELSIYVLSPLPLLSFIIYKISSVINRKSELTQIQQSKLSSYVQESFSGIRILKSYVREKYFQNEFKKETENYKQASLNLAYVNSLFIPAIVLLIGLSTIITIYIGGIKTINKEIDYGDIVQFIFYINMLTWPIASVGWLTSLVQRAAASQKRINEFLENKQTIDFSAVESISEIRNLDMKNVCFSYNKEIEVLKGMSFSLKKGDTLGIIGKTGTGKTTIASLICKIYDINNGSILINNKEIDIYNISILRSKIAYVPQDVFLFSDTIYNNIAFGKIGATKEQVINAAKLACIYNDIMGFTDRFDTKIGERGVNLSGGQKQRISIARALIRKSEILILDDCLSAVDTLTENIILNNIYNNSDDKITIIISHRINAILKADNIIVIDEGTIAQQGSHTELIQKQGQYALLNKKQAN